MEERRGNLINFHGLIADYSALHVVRVSKAAINLKQVVRLEIHFLRIENNLIELARFGKALNDFVRNISSQIDA